jgi:hypothetical protein
MACAAFFSHANERPRAAGNQRCSEAGAGGEEKEELSDFSTTSVDNFVRKHTAGAAIRLLVWPRTRCTPSEQQNGQPPEID